MHPEQVVELYLGEGEQPYQSTSYPSYLELRDRNEVLSGLAAYSMQQFRLGDAGEVESIWGEAVSGNYFDVLGVPAQKGRTFAADEDLVPRQKPVAVISHSADVCKRDDVVGFRGPRCLLYSSPTSNGDRPDRGTTV